ncbi:NME/NM23 family member 9, transcript variant X10 [Ictidomys tridecemlineatus]|uniref:thioredoxin domain-containing protein 6 isoform X19 n=1 Tax=Ictidomys tridecemlineatus TaxID=43179 RepID=UPI000B53D3D6|nr:thioredoxin domain-containing protein 6 isoform X19 [Ictidomys tridecemlineatus]XP_040125813.1 thioredoxin domain-containing protein 6 isoform X19 [Ictidomys tridecemlineatus]KAG3270731.1 NME/NM23 family member 9, transcript variant X10 [Ictidomys tridecemlineatus]
MGSKKKEIALQFLADTTSLLVNISTQELWEEMLSSKGLTVVDVYQGWCGPCKPVVSLFQKMRIEVGLDLLHFALAEADCLDVLEKYRGKCEPTFLFYAGGELVAVVRGANAPLLEKTILDQLEAEKKVLAEGRERKVSLLNACEKRQTLTFKISMNFLVLPVTLHPATKKDLIKDEALSDEDEYFLHEKNVGEDEDVALHSSSLTAEASTHFHSWATWLASEDSWESVSSEKTCTLAIIKPDAVVHGKTDEIIMKIQEAGFDILTNEERTMTEAEMRLFYQHRAGEDQGQRGCDYCLANPNGAL